MDAKKLRAEITRYSRKNGYPAQHFASPTCPCGHTRFALLMNEEEGVAARVCRACNSEHGIGDSDEYIDEVESVYGVECSCGGDEFEVMAGVALYQDSTDVRWFYLGLECTACGLAGVHGDWKNEHEGYEALLANV